MANVMEGLEAEVTSGAQPLQIEGTIDNEPFVFRARGQHWTMAIGGDPANEPKWQMGDAWGYKPDAADRMPEDVGRAIVERCCTVWRTYRALEGRSGR